MISLFIDTTTNHLRIGLYRDKEQIFFEDEIVKNDLSSKALPKIKEALSKVDLSVNNIDEIYVANGPGSFTGIRVGVTIAKTLAWSLNKPIYTVSELQVLASGTPNKINIPLIDARRGFVYSAIYDKKLKTLFKEKYISLEELKEEVKNYKKGEVSFLSYDELEGVIEPSIDISRLLNNVKFKPLNPHLVNPNYLKKTEAEEKLNDRKIKKK